MPQKGLEMLKALTFGIVAVASIIVLAGPEGALAEPKSKAGTQVAPDNGAATTPGSAELTAEECRKLGGAVHTAPQCKKTGTRCVIRLQGGQINAPCIDEVSEKK